MHVVATSSKKSALANLASWFHQDSKLMGIEADQWGKEFIKPLSTGQRRVLRAELLEFMAAYPGTSAKGIRNAWVRLGAAGWPRSANLREMMDSWIKALE
jgi:hypothetical protein